MKTRYALCFVCENCGSIVKAEVIVNREMQGQRCDRCEAVYAVAVTIKQGLILDNEGPGADESD